MQNLRQLEQDILANGRVEGPELERLRTALYVDGKVDRKSADFLAELYKRVQRKTPNFEKFFYQAIKHHILQDGSIRPGETAWLRQLLLADGKIDDHERKLLHELQGEAKTTCPEFDALMHECLKLPPPQHTSG